MTEKQWTKVTDRYFTPEEKAEFAARMPPPGEFDQEDYNREWADLSARVQAVIPLGPHSKEAQALFHEWQTLLKPFTDVATPAMMKGVCNFYEHMDEWMGEVPNAPFSPEVFKFIQEVGRRRKT